jgi:hypothetical protein
MARPVGLVAAVLLTVGACSGDDPAPAADTVAGAVAEAFSVPDGGRSCLEDRFAASADARRAVAATDELTAAEEQALGDVLEACIEPAELADSVAGRIDAALPPEDPAQAETQTACLRQGVLDLDEEQRRSLEVGLIALTAPPDADLSLRRNDVVNGLYVACGVAPGP